MTDSRPEISRNVWKSVCNSCLLDCFFALHCIWLHLLRNLILWNLEKCSSLVRVLTLGVHVSRALRCKMTRVCECSWYATVHDSSQESCSFLSFSFKTISSHFFLWNFSHLSWKSTLSETWDYLNMPCSFKCYTVPTSSLLRREDDGEHLPSFVGTNACNMPCWACYSNILCYRAYLYITIIINK
jgi:hypothetical protein